MPSLSLCAFLAVALPASLLENLASLSTNGTVMAEYRQEREFKGTSVKLVIDGAMAYERGKGLVWSTTSPMKTKTVILSDSLRQWSAATGKTSEIKLSDASFLKAVTECQNAWFSGDLNSLKGFEAKAIDGNTVDLVATDRSVGEFFSRMRIVFSFASSAIRRVELFEKSGDVTTIRFRNVKNNVALPQTVWECP